ncbi:hypothetical protein [Alkalicoccobacillus plakortidis]|uniref:Outer membrane lipoprotein-sorting protein n=1 Tax=Alkalicoccobacillus plakortidis TaxID=444060 RepID=A0ABT0XF27_9BACI|nr:hypothetical protein [Alkalicoccobacillus plakortidis]MCM2674494.1 hypothetical protein [Alkalicoccobacillus plakortidis]
MKKAVIATLISSVTILGACNSDDSSTESTETDQVNENETTTTDEMDSNDELTAEEIVEEAIALYGDLEGLYVLREGSGDLNFEPPEEDEAGNLDMELEMSTYEWTYVTDGDLYNRTESVMESSGEEEGGESTNAESTSYSFTDIDEPSYLITYNEGDEEAVRIENPTTEEFTFDMIGERYQGLLEEAELTLEGEEEVNGYQAYHITAEVDDGIEEYWFDTETFFEVKGEISMSSESEEQSVDSSVTAGDTVIEYKLNPDFDETLFQVPEDLEVVDGEIGDTIGE